MAAACGCHSVLLGDMPRRFHLCVVSGTMCRRLRDCRMEGEEWRELRERSGQGSRWVSRRGGECPPSPTPLLLCGDFNMHHPQWEPFLETSSSEVAAEFLELCTDAGLTLVNIPGEITCARGTRERSCIDLTWSKHLTVSDWSASVSPLSDHYMLTFTLHQAFKDTIPSAPPSAPRIFYSWGSAIGIHSSRTSTHNFRHTTIKSSPPALKTSRERL
ncbi:membrane associated protein [Trypanosoma cruzi]|nr:membrane associated protein [Trypanosoma cruzi]